MPSKPRSIGLFSFSSSSSASLPAPFGDSTKVEGGFSMSPRSFDGVAEAILLAVVGMSYDKVAEDDLKGSIF